MSVTPAGSAGRLLVAPRVAGPGDRSEDDLAPLTALPAADTAGRAARAARAGRRARADALAGRLRQMMADAGGTVPPLPPLPEPTADWIRTLSGVPVRTPAFEAALARRTLTDLFGFLALPPAPPFLHGLALDAVPPEHAAPLLTRLSMTRPAPQPADLTPAALATSPGPVTRAHRGPAARRWGQRPSANAPLLPEHVAIPHLIHAIWLGGPVPDGAPLRATLTDLARRHAGQADLVLWTDVTRADLTAADATTPGPPGPPTPTPPPAPCSPGPAPAASASSTSTRSSTPPAP
jgi:hypothetical protein